MNSPEELEKEKLLRSNNDLKKFAYMVSHDLQGPIRRISSFCEITREELEDNNIDKASEYLTQIEKVCHDASGMIFDILNLCKLGNEDFTRNKISLDKLIHTSLIPFSGQVERNEIEINFKPISEDHIIANFQNIRDVFFNLITNAIKYKKPAVRAKISITTSVSKDSKYIVFEVKDNGEGIEDTSSVFKFLARESSNENGYGIGLATCQKIIHAHMGEIWCESTPNQGSSFFFSLPRAES